MLLLYLNKAEGCADALLVNLVAVFTKLLGFVWVVEIEDCHFIAPVLYPTPPVAFLVAVWVVDRQILF